MGNSKKMELRENLNKTGFDLLIERDAGNTILILMGGKEESQKENWENLKRIAEHALFELSLKDVEYNNLKS